MKPSTCCQLAAVILLLAGCAPPQPPPQKSDCQVGSDVKGLAAGFFAIVQDRPECF